MHDHNLDDLIIDTAPSTTSRAKNILSLLALFIVVLIAGIVLYKIFLAEQEQAPTLEDNISKYYKSGLKPKNDKQTLSLQDEEIDDDFMPPQHPLVKNKHTAPTKPDVASETVRISAKDTQTPTSKPNATPSAELTEPVQTLPKRKTPAQTAPDKPKPAKTAPPKKAKEKPHAKPTPASPKKHRVTKILYYVQVGSYSKPPSAKSTIINAIKKYGYRYEIYKTNGMYKVLIGPYATRSQADKHINMIRLRINAGAFVFKK